MHNQELTELKIAIDEAGGEATVHGDVLTGNFAGLQFRIDAGDDYSVMGAPLSVIDDEDGIDDELVFSHESPCLAGLVVFLWSLATDEE